MTFRFPEEIAAGEYKIHIKWVADLNKEMQGLYRTTYFDLKGRRRSTFASNFEPTFARRCFPCFDEPKSKVKRKDCCVSLSFCF